VHSFLRTRSPSTTSFSPLVPPSDLSVAGCRVSPFSSRKYRPVPRAQVFTLASASSIQLVCLSRCQQPFFLSLFSPESLCSSPDTALPLLSTKRCFSRQPLIFYHGVAGSALPSDATAASSSGRFQQPPQRQLEANEQPLSPPLSTMRSSLASTPHKKDQQLPFMPGRISPTFSTEPVLLS